MAMLNEMGGRRFARPDAWGRQQDDPEYGQAPMNQPSVVPENRPLSGMVPPPPPHPARGRPLNTFAQPARQRSQAMLMPPGDREAPPMPTGPMDTEAPPREKTGPIAPSAPFQYGAQGAPALRRDVYGDFAGFDTEREHNIAKSAKDAFTFAAQQQAAADSFVQASASKEGSEAWFNQYIRPVLEAQGYTIDWVKGDQAFIRSWDGVGTVDFVVNAGHPDPAQRKLAWQPTPQGEQPTAPYQPRQAPVADPVDDPTNETLPEPIYNEDGTVTLRVSPEAYRRLIPQMGESTDRNPYRKTLSDMVRPREAV
jgi:hypothetical protein